MLQFATLRQDSQCRTFESPTDCAAENHNISRLILLVLFRRVMWYLVLYEAVLFVGFRLVQKSLHLLIFSKSYSHTKVVLFFSAYGMLPEKAE